MMDIPSTSFPRRAVPKLQRLNPEQVLLIDRTLAELGDYGELHLVIEKGKLRFLVVQKSIDALKLQRSDPETSEGQ